MIEQNDIDELLRLFETPWTMVAMNPEEHGLVMVTPKPMTHVVEGFSADAEIKHCYHNSYKTLRNASMQVSDMDEWRYVVGIAMGVIPVNHSWVKYRNDYYDPTWERFTEDGIRDKYYPVAELTYAELMEVVMDNDYLPPCAIDMLTKYPELLVKDAAALRKAYDESRVAKYVEGLER